MAGTKSKGIAPLSKKAARTKSQQIKDRKAAQKTAGERKNARP
jgi:hypothetical protein